MAILKTSYHNNIPNLEDEPRILINVSNAAFHRRIDYHLKGLAPPWDLVKWWKEEWASTPDGKDKEKEWKRFRTTYLDHLMTSDYAANHLKIIVNMLESREGTIYLLCWEKDEKYCHRTILKEYVQQCYEDKLKDDSWDPMNDPMIYGNWGAK